MAEVSIPITLVDKFTSDFKSAMKTAEAQAVLASVKQQRAAEQAYSKLAALADKELKAEKKAKKVQLSDTEKSAKQLAAFDKKYKKDKDAEAKKKAQELYSRERKNIEKHGQLLGGIINLQNKIKTGVKDWASENSMLIGGALALGAAIVAAGKAVMDQAIAGERFERTWRNALEVTTRHSSGIQEMVGHIRKVSGVSGIGADTIAKWTMQLTEFGMKGPMLDKTIAAMSDLQAMGFNPEAFTSARKAIRDIELSTTHLITGQKIEELWRNTGMDPAKIAKGIQTLDKYKHLSERQIMAMLRSMEFDPDEAEKAMLAAVQRATGGELGSYAKKTTGVGQEAAINRALMKLQDTLSRFKYDEQIAKIIDRVTGLFLDPRFMAAIEIFGYMIQATIDILGKLLIFSAGYTAFQMNILTNLVAAYSWVGEKTYKLWYGVGQAIYDGIAYWFKQLFWQFDKIGEMSSSLVKRVKGVFGINSPSKVFMDIGDNMGEGMQIGINRSMPDLTGSVSIPSVSPPSSSSTTSNSATQNNVFNYTSGSPSSTEDFEVFRRNMIRLFAGVMEEAGMVS